MHCPRCLDVTLDDNGPLGALCCSRCGGGHFPVDATTKLLEDELGHSKAQLKELSELMAGSRLRCAHCTTRMSPLPLRGATVDLCYGCGALWLDPGELEQITGRRRKLPPRRAALAEAPGIARVVRFERRPHLQLPLRNVMGGLGVALLVAFVVKGAAFAGLAGWAVAAMVAAALLTRQRAVDVHMPSRKIVFVRGWATDALGAAQRALPLGAVVRVRAVPLLPAGVMAERARRFRIDVVDEEGRIVVPGEVRWTFFGARDRATELAQALGVRIHDDVDVTPRAAVGLRDPALLEAPEEWVVRATDWPVRRTIVVSDADAKVLARAEPVRPLERVPSRLGAILAEQWEIVCEGSGEKVRLMPRPLAPGDDALTCVLVHDDDSCLGHVWVARRPLFDVIGWWSPLRERAIWSRVVYAIGDSRLRDAAGHARGRVQVAPPGAQLPAHVRAWIGAGAGTGRDRLCLAAMLVHASLASAAPDL